MQKRVLEIALSANPQDFDAAWADIRRGWYLGSDDFRKGLMEKIDEGLAGKRNDSFSGGAIREHNEAEAERLLLEGLTRLGLLSDDLEALRKGAPEKMVLAWMLKKQTVVKNEWISRHLFCGHPANVPGYVRKVDDAKEGELAELRKTLKSED